MIKRSLVALLLCFTGLYSKADSNSILQEGITAFQQSQWDLAKEKFTKLSDDSAYRAAAYYNLGNVSVRQKHLGEALAYYRKALTLSPHFSDARFNLGFVLSALKIDQTWSTSSMDVIRRQWLNRFSFNDALMAILFFSTIFLQTFYVFFKKRKIAAESEGEIRSPNPSAALIISGVFFLLTLVFAGLKLVDSFTARGTIISEKVDLRSGPGEANASLGSVTEGLEVDVNQDMNGWMQVTYAGGLSGRVTGWLPENSLVVTSGEGPWK